MKWKHEKKGKYRDGHKPLGTKQAFRKQQSFMNSHGGLHLLNDAGRQGQSASTGWDHS
jgi:hypothetical protein